MEISPLSHSKHTKYIKQQKSNSKTHTGAYIPNVSADKLALALLAVLGLGVSGCSSQKTEGQQNYEPVSITENIKISGGIFQKLSDAGISPEKFLKMSLEDKIKTLTKHGYEIDKNVFNGDFSKQISVKACDKSELYEKYKDVPLPEIEKEIKQNAAASKKSFENLRRDTANLEIELKPIISKFPTEIQAKINKNLDKINNTLNYKPDELLSIVKNIQELNIEIQMLKKNLNNSKTKEERVDIKNNLSEKINKLRNLENKRVSIVCDRLKQRINMYLAICENYEYIFSEAQKMDISTAKLQSKIEVVRKSFKTFENEFQKNIELNKAYFMKNFYKNNVTNDFEDFDNVDLSLSKSQRSDIQDFLECWLENKNRYEKIGRKTDLPPILVASIHWRESSGDFSTYLHNGDPLGKPTTHVPKGKYFENFEDAAADALLEEKNSRDYGLDYASTDINKMADFAEHYNGMGYHNRGLDSPYVKAGVAGANLGGMYVADGVFDKNAKDSRGGTMALQKSIFEAEKLQKMHPEKQPAQIAVQTAASL